MDIQALAAALRRGESAPAPPPVPEQPYVYRPFPKVKYHASQDPVIVHSDDEETRLGTEWGDSPEDATAIKDRLDDAVAVAAAERAFDDRRLGEHARAELTAYEREAGEHVLDVPVSKG